MADDYGKIKRIGMLAYRKIRYELQYFGLNVAEANKGNEIIKQFIESAKPGFVGRIGAVESRYVSSVIENRQPTKSNLRNLELCAGVFPLTDRSMADFYREYTCALSQTDIFVAWSVQGGGTLFREYCPKAKLVGFYALEPFFYDNPWTEALAHKKVLIIHPFVNTIKQQYEKRELLFDNKKILPEFQKIEYVKAVQSNAGNDKEIQFEDWLSALDFMKSEIKKKEFDIAIIGAGSYGLPLAAYVKKLGKQAIHMAGVTQLLFGIRGKRWDNDKLYHTFFNKNWCYPSVEETPKGNGQVEGGTYWK